VRRSSDPGACGVGDASCMSANYDLTERERAAAVLLAYGHTNREIAQRLGVSVRTVEGERSRLMHKLGLERRSELVSWALDRGLLH
jgi:two-component system, NarL family, response regulator NreC